MDKVDKKIIKILQENCKITNLELSKQIGLSPAPTLERVKKLEQLGVIDSYHAHINPLSIGLNVSTYALVSIAWQHENALDNFIKKIQDVDEIIECYIVTGDADALIKVICKDIPSYESLLFKTLAKIKEVERIKTLVTLSSAKSAKVLPYNYAGGPK